MSAFRMELRCNADDCQRDWLGIVWWCGCITFGVWGEAGSPIDTAGGDAARGHFTVVGTNALRSTCLRVLKVPLTPLALPHEVLRRWWATMQRVQQRVGEAVVSWEVPPPSISSLESVGVCEGFACAISASFFFIRRKF